MNSKSGNSGNGTASVSIVRTLSVCCVEMCDHRWPLVKTVHSEKSCSFRFVCDSCRPISRRGKQEEQRSRVLWMSDLSSGGSGMCRMATISCREVFKSCLTDHRLFWCSIAIHQTAVRRRQIVHCHAHSRVSVKNQIASNDEGEFRQITRPETVMVPWDERGLS